jgi:phospholipase/lecithinase/hemolysin
MHLPFSTVLLPSLSILFNPTHAQAADPVPPTFWSSPSRLTTLFSFGDSYTATGFLPNSTQPSLTNPLGNPPLPGRTFSNGRNWLTSLATEYNASSLRIYNFAMGGSIVDSFGVPYPFRPLSEQIDRFFLPNYGGAGNGTQREGDNRIGWTSSATLFALFFGINDVNGAVVQAFNSSSSTRTSTNNSTNGTAVPSYDSSLDFLLTRTITAYDQHIETLYKAGARNFLFLNVPAIHRVPAATVQGEDMVAAIRDAVLDFNSRVRDTVLQVLRRHPEATAFLLDTFSLFDAVLDEPESRVETAVYRNTTGFCEAYANYPYVDSILILPSLERVPFVTLPGYTD